MDDTRNLADAFAPLPDTELVELDTTAPASSPDFTPMQPPADPVASMFKLRGITASSCWTYTDAAGVVALVAVRFDKPDGRKEVLPFRYGRKGKNPGRWWQGLHGLRSAPLYNRPALATNPGTAVLVVEGEKAANAAAASQGGSHAARKADWSPLVGRVVTIWPDHDEAGADYARDAADMARKAGAASVAVVTIPERWPEKWDLADALPDGVTHDDLRAMLADAAQVQSQTQAKADGVTMPAGFFFRERITRPGLYLQAAEPSPRDPEPSPTFVAGLFDVIGETSDGTGAGHGTVLRWTDRHGHHHTQAVAHRLGHGDGRGLASMFADAGLHVGTTFKAYDGLRRFILEVRHRRRLVSVVRTGWHDAGGKPCFILPGGEAFGPGKDDVILQAEMDKIEKAFRTGGTLDGWQSEVAAPAVGNDLLVLAISAAFAAPLLDVAGEQSGGLHLFGKSRAGKTSVMRAGASVWGKASEDGMIRPWRATANGLEGIAAATSDTLLCLDEIGQATGKDVFDAVYMLANGSTKARAGRNGDARQSKTWRTLFLSTGEVDLAAKLGEAGLRMMAGQEARFPSLSSDIGAFGAFNHLGTFPDLPTFGRALTLAAQRHYGHAGRAFLARLTKDRGDALEGLTALLGEWRAAFLASAMPDGADAQVATVASRFALLASAGELAAAWGIVPWPEGEATRAAMACFKRWLTARGGGEAGEDIEAVRLVRAFIAANGTSRFELIRTEGNERPEEKTINRAGWRRQTEGGGWEYLVSPDAWRTEVCRGADPKRVASVLSLKGLLLSGAGRLQHMTRIPGQGTAPIRVYAVKGAILNAEAGDDVQ